MSGLELGDGEIEELYILLKPREQDLSQELLRLLNRIEKSLYTRMTVKELEELSLRFRFPH
jgi:hypothetical protein